MAKKHTPPASAEQLLGHITAAAAAKQEIPEQAELCRSIMKQLGGVDVVSQIWKDTYDNAKPATKSRMLVDFFRMMANAKREDRQRGLSDFTKQELIATLQGSFPAMLNSLNAAGTGEEDTGGQDDHPEGEGGQATEATGAD